MKIFVSICVAIFSTVVFGVELLNNPVFFNPQKISNESAAALKSNGVVVNGSGIPFGWRISTNGLKVNNGVVNSQAVKNQKRVSLHFSSNSGEIIFYNFMRIPLKKLENSNWILSASIHGEKGATVIAYGYNAAGKCVYYKSLGYMKLNRKSYPQPVIIDIEQLKQNDAVEFCIGLSIAGKANLYAIQFKDATLEEKKKIQNAELEFQKSRTLANGSFENNGDWKLIEHDGAKGYIKFVNGGKSGKKALQLVKSNAKGFLQLQAVKPITVDAFEKYLFRGWFSTQTSQIDSLLLFRICNDQNDQFFRYDDIDRSFGFPSQALLTNNSVGKWTKRVISFSPKADGKVYLNVILTGNPAEVLLDDLEFVKNNYYRPAPKDLTKRTTFKYSEQDVYEILKKRTAEVAHLRKNQNKMEMVLNGNPVIPVLYKSETFHGDYVYNRFTEFDQALVPFVIKSVQLSDAKLNKGVVIAPGKYDYQLLTQVIMRALQQNPYARLVICLGMNEPYPNWGKNHPNDLWRNEKGEFGWGTWGNCEGYVSDLSQVKQSGIRAKWYVWPFGSYSSKSYCQAHCQSIKDIVSYLMKSPFGKAIVGFHIGGGHDGQFQYFRPDYSTVAVKSFQNFLEKRYKTIEKLNQALESNYTSFTEIKIPPYAKMRFPRKPFDAGIIAQYKAFQRYESWKLKHTLAQAARDAAGKPVFVSSYGMPLDYHGATFCETSGGVDLFVVPSWYPFRRMGYPIGAKPDATFALHNKMWLNELDLRTWTEPASDEVKDMWVGSALNLEQWESVQRKFAGVALAHNYAWWYYSMYRYFDRPEVMTEIKKAMQHAKKVIAKPASNFTPDVCVIRSEKGDDIISAIGSADQNNVIFPYQLMNFETSGVPYDLHELSDVVSNPKLQNYKMYVFLHTAQFNAAERKIIEKLKQSGKLLVFLYNSGYYSEQRASVENIKKLTGFEVSTTSSFGRKAAFLEVGNPLTANIHPMISGSEIIYSALAVRGASPHSNMYQIFTIAKAPESQVIARYSDGTVAGAIKNNVVYLAAPFSLSGGLFHNLARKAGAFCVANPGQSIHMNGNFISLHVTKPGKVELQLPPGKSKAEDLFNNRTIEAVNGKITMDLAFGKTHWLLLH